jgi:dipeptidyl aminopeptidase/acylaminoacyl peptidase
VTYSIEDFLNIKTAAGSGFNPDGSKLLISSNLTGTSQLYRVSTAGGSLEQVTDFDEPVSGAYMPTSDDVIFLRDEGGNERTQIYMCDDECRAIRTLVSDPDYIHRIGGITRDGTRFAMTSNRRNGRDFDVYVVDLASGEHRLVFQMGGWCESAGFSPDGRLLAVSRMTERSMDNDVYLIDLQTDDVLHVCPHEEEASVGIPSWMPDSRTFFFATDVDRDFSAIARYDLASRSWERVLEDEWNLTCGIDWVARSMLVTKNEDGYPKTSLYDPHTLERRRDLPLPGKGMAAARASRDGRLFALTYLSPVESGDVWVYDLDTDELRRLTESPRPVPADVLVEPELHRFTSFDGESIPVFLYRPKDATSDVPVIVQIHGGPEGQYIPTFSPVIQYLVHRGYAVAAPNVRGSTGYGKRYHHLDDKRRRLDSVRDLESLYRWLAQTPGVDAKRAALWGGSYGGYMVLAGLAFQPDLWAAGVDIVGISSFVTFLENTAVWRRSFREREYGSLEEDREFLIEASPITHVDRIRSPLFIIHGTNDPRVPLGEAEQIHAALTEKGIPTELLVYPDEGHGLAKLKNRLDAYPKAVAFLDRILLP